MNIVRELRKRKGVQQKELAMGIGCSIPTVSDWETGKKDPSGERLQKLAKYFGVDELVVLGKEVLTVGNSDANIPKTIEARILAKGIDKLPKEQREQALSVVKAMFAKYEDYFERENADDT